MKAVIIYYLQKLILITFAPLYFHFGQAAWLIDLNVYLLEAVDVIALFFLFFLFTGIAVYTKNFILSFLLNKTFNFYSFKRFTLPLTQFFLAF
jgi:hypothetical protein